MHDIIVQKGECGVDEVSSRLALILPFDCLAAQSSRICSRRMAFYCSFSSFLPMLTLDTLDLFFTMNRLGPSIRQTHGRGA
jgi:hypothetical protein